MDNDLFDPNRKILLLSHGDSDYDGRLRELFQVASLLGDVTLISRGSRSLSEKHILLSADLKANYLTFFKQCIRLAKQHGPYHLILGDNRKSILPAYRLHKFYPSSVLVFDCRELYLLQDVQGFSSKMGCVIEQIFNRKADALIAANKERAKIMRKHYGIKAPIFIYENLRQLSYPEHFCAPTFDPEIEAALASDKIKFISTSGCSFSRTNDKLALAMGNFSEQALLFLVGASEDNERQAMRKLLSDNEITNVFILGQQNEGNLKYLISRSDVGVVNYHQNDSNNRFCASGKLYEFIFEGKPVLTTANPPLQAITEASEVGTSFASYTESIRTLLDKYDRFAVRVCELAGSLSVYKNNMQLAEELCQLLQHPA